MRDWFGFSDGGSTGLQSGEFRHLIMEGFSPGDLYGHDFRGAAGMVSEGHGFSRAVKTLQSCGFSR
jgi:hypothetical protein